MQDLHITLLKLIKLLPLDSFLHLTKVPFRSSFAFQLNNNSSCLMSSAKWSVFSILTSRTLVKVVNNIVLTTNPWGRPLVRSQTIDQYTFSICLVVHLSSSHLLSLATRILHDIILKSLLGVKVADTHFSIKNNHDQTQSPNKALLEESPSCPTSA